MIKTRYSDKDLEVFARHIKVKIEETKNCLKCLKSEIQNENDTSDTFKSSKGFNEEVAEHSSNELYKRLIERKEKFLRDLSLAEDRIKNKSYGVCRITGKLIPKERLLAAPHTTLSIEAKLQTQKRN